MRLFIIIGSLLALALIAFNATKLNFEMPFEGESFTAVLTILAGLCALVLLQILRLSKKIEKLHNQKR